MTIKFKTYSGSVYEVDQDNKQYRRISGMKDPTPRQSKDGEWRKYASIGMFGDNLIEIGQPVFFFYDPKDTPLHEGSDKNASPTTITSYVVEMLSE